MTKILCNVEVNNNELQEAVIQKLSVAPQNPVVGLIYFNTVDKKFYICKEIVNSQAVWDSWVNEEYTMDWDETNQALTLSDGIASQSLPLTGLAKDDDVINLQAQINALGEPFRVKNWAGSNLNVQIPYCTEDIGNTSIPKMTFTITGQEAIDYQVVGMIAYEVKDSGGQRINCWPVCQFTGQGQTELSVRWMCGGTTRKTASAINAWVLLKHR